MKKFDRIMKFIFIRITKRKNHRKKKKLKENMFE